MNKKAVSKLEKRAPTEVQGKGKVVSYLQVRSQKGVIITRGGKLEK